MENNKNTRQSLGEPPVEKKKFFWVLLAFVLIIGIWIGVQGANQGVLTLATSAQGLTNKDGDIKVRVRAIDAANAKENLYTIDQTAVVKDGQLKLRWQIPPTAKKKAAYIEICALDARAGPSSSVKSACIEQVGDIAYNKVSCPYYVPANSTGFSGQLNGWNKLDDSQKIGCQGNQGFGKVSSLKDLATAQSPGIQVDGGGVLVAENGKIQTQDVDQFVKDALSQIGSSVVQVTTNIPVPGSQGAAGANGTNGADGAVGIATVSGGGLILTGQNLSLDDSCLGGQILQWDGSNWNCATVSGTDSQTLSLVANVLAISGGNSVNLAGYLDNTDSQALSWVGGTRTLSLTGGGSVVISDSDTTYSAGNGLSLSGTTFSINSPTCAGTTKLTWNGTAFSCASDVDTDTTNFNVAANGGAGQNISSGSTVNFTNGTGTTASRSGSDISFGLANTAVTGGTYSASNNANGSLALPQFTVDAQGRLTAASTSNVTLTGIANSQLANSAITINTAGPLAGGGSVSLGGSLNLSLDLSDTGDSATATTSSGSGLEISGNEVGLLRGCSSNQLLKWNAASLRWECASDTDTDTNSGGTVTSITAGTGLSGGTITTSGTINIATTGVTAATYGSSTSIPVITVNAQGQITAASSTAIPNASTSTTGLLTSTDWNTFNGKENVLTFTGNGLFSRSGNTITGLACTGSQIAKWSGSAFACGADNDTTYSAGDGLSLSGTTFSINSPTCSGTDKLQWTGTVFVCAADVDTDTGVTSVGTIDSQTKSANGAVISGTSLVLQTADASNPGLVSTTTQTFAGAKTFSGNINTNGDVTLGDSAADGITILGEIRGASPLAFEGLTNDGIYTTFAITDPTIARTITFPDRSGTVSLSGDTFTGDVTGTLNSTGATALTIAANSVALGTDTTGDYVAGNTAGNGISVSGSAGEGWSPTIAINAPTCAGTDKLTWNGSAFSCASDVDTDTDTTNFNVAAAGTGGSQNISSGGTVTFGNGTGTTATRSGSTVTYGLNNTAVSAGSYAPADNADGSLALPQFTVDAQGRLTAASTTNVTLTGIANSQLTNSAITINTTGPITGGGSVSLGGSLSLNFDLSDAGDNNTATTSSGSGLEVSSGEIGLLRGCSTGELLKYNTTSKQWACAADTDTNSGGTVTSITAGTGLSGGTITTSGTINIASTGVTAATYGSSTSIPVIAVNAQGQITSATSTAIPISDTSTTGLLTDTDWDTFNGKENVLTFTGNGLFSRSGNTITGLACSAGEIPKWSGSAFACGADAGGASYTAGNGLTLTGASFSINSPTCAGTDKLQWNGTAFVCSADVDTDTGVTSVGTIDSQTKSANGAVISGTSLVLQTADGSSPGLVSTTTQTFAGAKTFSGNVNANGDVTLGDASADGITINGEIRGANPLVFEGATNDGVYTTFAVTDPTLARTITFPDRSGTVSLSGDTFTGDVTGTLNSSGATALTIAANSVALGTDTTGDYVAGNTAGNGISVTGSAGEGWSPTIAINSPTCAGTDKLTWNGSAFSCAADVDTDTDTTNFNVAAAGTGGSQNITSGDTVTFGNGTGTTATRSGSTVTYSLNNTAVSAASYAPSDNANGSLALPQFTVDAQGRLTAASTTNVTLTGIANSQLTNSAITVNTAGGLTGGSSVSLGGSINLSLDLSDASDANTATTSSGSGLEVSSGEIGLLRGCATGELLKYNSTTNLWACATDTDTDTDTGVTSVGTIDSQTKAANGAVISGSVIYLQTADASNVGLVSTGTQTFAGSKTFNGNLIADANLTANGDVTLGNASSDGLTFTGEVRGASPLAFEGATNDGVYTTFAITDPTLARTVTFPDRSGTVSLSGDTFTGDVTGTLNASGATTLTIAANSVALGTDTTGDYVSSVTAGGGLTGTATGEGSTPTLAIVSSNGGIVVNADDIALTITASANGLSSTTSSGSGLEILSTGLTLLQGCSNSQLLKWNETTDVWECAADTDTDTDTGVTSVGTIDSQTKSANGAVISGTVVYLQTADASAPGLVSTGTQTFAGDKTFNGNVITGGNLTANGDVTLGNAATDAITFTGEVRGASPLAFEGTTNDGVYTTFAITDPTVARTITFPDRSGTVSLSGDTFTGDVTGTLNSTGATALTIAANSVALGTDTTGDYVANVTAGGGLTGSATGEGSTPTLAIVSSNGGIVINADDVALTIAASADALSSTTSSGSGLEILSSGLTLLQGCSNNQLLKWNETTDVWACATDTDTDTDTGVTSVGTIDSQTKSANGAVISGTVVYLQTADASNPGLVSTGTQTFAGDKTFNGNVITGGNLTANGDVTLGDAATDGITVTGEIRGASPLAFEGVTNDNVYTTFAVTDPTTAQTITFPDATGTVLLHSMISGDATVTSAGALTIAANAVALGTDTTGNYVAGNTAGNGISVSGSAGEGWSPTIAINSPTCAGTDKLTWSGTAFSCAADVDTDTGVTSVGTIDSQTKSANGAVISGTSLVLQTADGSNPGLVSTTTQTFAGDKTFSGNVSANGDVTLGDSAADGITITGEIRGASPLAFEGATNDGVYTTFAITDPTLARTITFPDRSGTVSLSGDTFTGDVTGTLNASGATALTIAANAVALGTDTTGNYVADVAAGTGLSVSGTPGEGWTPTVSLANTAVTAGTYAPADNANGSIAVPQFTVDAQGRLTAASTTNITPTGIANAQLANSSLTITAGAGLANGGAVSLGGTVALDIGAGNGITVNANDITIDLTAATDALSATTSSSSGLEVLSTGLTLLQGCSDGQLLKWNETTDVWGCSADIDTDTGVTTIGTLDSLTKSANGAVISGSTLVLQTADATMPGLVSTGTQTFAGAKTLTGATTISGTSNATKFRVLDSGGFSVLNVSTSGTGAVTIGAAGGNAPVFTVRNNSQNVFVVNSLANTLVSNIGSIDFQDAAGSTSLFSADEGTGFVGIGYGPGAASFKLDVDGDINSTTGYYIAGTAGATTTCSGGQFLQNAVLQGGLTTAGTCNGTVVTSIGTIDSQTKSANGAVISGNTLVMQTADATHPGLVSTGTQTFAGNKTFSDDVTIASTGSFTVNATTGGPLLQTDAGSKAINGEVNFIDFHDDSMANILSAGAISGSGGVNLGDVGIITSVLGDFYSYGTAGFYNATDSVAAFTIGDQFSTPLLTADTANKGIIIGDGVTNDVGFSVIGPGGVGTFGVTTASGGNVEIEADVFEVWDATVTNRLIFADGPNDKVGIGLATSPGYTLDVGGDTNISSGSKYRINGLDINTAGTLSNVAYLNQANTFTLNNNFSTSVTTPMLTSTAGLSVTGGTTLALRSVGSNAISIDSTGTGAINIGNNGASAKIITIGNGNSTTAVTIDTGTGIMNIGTNATQHNISIGSTTGTSAVAVNCGTGSCQFGANATDHSTNIGSTTGTSATTIQSGTGNVKLQAAGSGTTGNIQIGAGGAGSTTPDLLVLDIKSSSGDPTGSSGAMYYNDNTGKFRCYQNGAWADCITVDTGVTSIGTFTGASIADGASISGTVLTLGGADATNPGLVSTTTQTFAGNKTFTGNVITNGSLQVDGSTILGDATTDTITAKGSMIANAAATATTDTTSGTGTNTTTVTISGTSFANGDIILIDNAGQDYYTRVTAGGGTSSLTVTPAVTFETARTVTKYNIQNIGATDSDYTTASNRFFQGYFLGGVVAGAGTTTLSDGSLASTVGMNFTSPSYTFKNTADSTSAFQVQTSGGTNVLGVDTSNKRVNIGTGGTPTSQLYVSGNLPTAAAGSIATGTAPLSQYISGKYAYVTNSTSNTLTIYNVSNPASPVSVGSIATGTSPRSVHVQGKYAYVVNFTSSTITIYDVSNPASPTSIGSLATGTGPQAVYVSGKYAYVSESTAGQVEIIDISNPASPISVGNTGVSSPLGLYVKGKYAYVADSASNTLEILDISNPASPSSAGSVITGTGPQAVHVQGKYAYVVNTAGGTISIVDISDPASPVVISSPSVTNPRSVYVQGKYMYAANGTANTIQVLDITDPASVTSVGTMSTNSIARSVFAQGRYVYAISQTGATLQVFDVGGSYIQQLEAGGLETNTLSTSGDVMFGNNTDIQGGLTVGGTAQFNSRVGFDDEILVNTSNNALNAQVAINAAAGKDTGLNVTGDVNSFYQINIQNVNGGSSSSSDFVATANNGTSTTYYVDLGINGSAGGAAPFTGANDAYLYASDSNNLHIGALGSSGAIKFYTTGGTGAPSLKLTLDSVGALTQTASSSTTTAFTLTANSLTSGNGLAIASTNTGTTGNLLSVTSASTSAFSNGGIRWNFTGAHTGNGVQIDDVTATGNVYQVNANSLTSGNGLVIGNTGTGLTGNLLSATTGSTSTFSNGGVRFNFTGAHAGNGVQIDDVTTAGTVMKITANSLVGGSGLAIASTNTGTTGNLFSVTSGSTAAFSNGGIRYNFTAAHTGNGVQVDDATATGNVYQVNANSLTSGNGLVIGNTGTGLTGNALSVTSGSTSALTNGIVRYNFTGAHTGNGFQIDDATTTGKVFQINASAITTGTAFEITGPSAAKLLRVKNDNGQGFNQAQLIVGEGDANNPDSLARDSLYVFGRINTSWNQMWTDCLTSEGTKTAATTATGVYGASYSGSGTLGRLSQGSVSGVSGVCRFSFATPSANATTFFGSGGSVTTQRSLNPVFEARVMSDANTDHRNIIGFTDNSASSAITADTNNSANEAFFRKTAAGTQWETVTRSASGTEQVNTNVGTTDAWHRLRVEMDDTNAVVRFYVDGTLVATHTTAPTAQIGFTAGNMVTSTTSRNLDVDYLRVWSDDPPESVAPGSIAEGEGLDTANQTETAAQEADQAPADDNSNDALLTRIKDLEADVDDLNQYKDVLTTETLGDASTNKAVFIADVEFRKQVEFSANALFHADVNVDGTLNVNGRVVVSNNTGTVTIQPNQMQVEVVFAKSLASKPNIFLSAENPDVKVVAQERTATGFIIKLSQPLSDPLDVQWFAVEKQ